LKERLKQIRAALGFNQQEMAVKLGFELTTYRSFEYKSKNLPIEFLCALIYTFSININWLLTGNGSMFINKEINSLKIKCDKSAPQLARFFNSRFKILLNENKLSNTQFSKLTGISENRTAELILNPAPPEINELISLKANFDVSADWLLFGSACSKTPSYNSLTEAEINILKKIAQSCI